MTELDIVNHSLASSREMREQLEARLAASSASRVGDRAEEVNQFSRSSLNLKVSTNNAILEAIRLCQPD